MEAALLPKIISYPVALGISILFTLSIIDLAKKLELFDANNNLKRHLEKVCSLGGIAIFAAFWIATCLVSGLEGTGIANYLFVGSFILFLTGVRDDLVGIPALKRLLIQIGVASMMFVGGIRLDYLPGFDMELPLWSSYFLTIFLIGAVVNAYNFIDGINGLSGGLAVISALTFAILFYFSGLEQFAAMSLALAGAISGFLWFNFGTAKIFMGDNGSTFIGIMLSFFAITFFQNHALAGGPIEWQPVIVLAILVVPIADMVKVVCSRMLRGESPFHGDRTHIHHLLLKRGFGPERICLLLYSWSIGIFLFSVSFLSQNIVIGTMVLALLSGVPYLVINLMAKAHAGKEKAKLSSAEPVN
ncbi:MAG: MraY family glycosyltransferase [Bacteroidota bacterium]